jgi:hypothetical protein
VIRITSADNRPIDVIVGRHAWQAGALQRAQQLPSGRRVVQPRDLVLLKLYAGGAEDVWDIEQLLAATDRAALIAQVEQDLRELPPQMAAVWQKARGPV